MKYQLTTVRIATTETQQQATNFGKDLKKLEPICTAVGNGKWCSCYGMQYDGSSKIKNRIINIMSSSNITYECTPIIIEASLLRNICTPMNIATLFTIAKCPQQMNG